jgi:two-component system cell cycle response regulator DivK
MDPTTKIILHIEDNSDNRLLVRRLLQSEGYNVIEAANAQEALAAISEYRPDLILMDINMPDVDGYSLTSQLKNNDGYGNFPIIAITANVMKGDREKSYQAGCDGYIDKPIDVDTFLDVIGRYLN